MSKEIKDIMDALENNELKNDGFWGRACSRLSQQLQTAKEENKKLIILSESLNVENQNQYEKIQSLTQQNKQLREALEKIANPQYAGNIGGDMVLLANLVGIAKQALKGE